MIQRWLEDKRLGRAHSDQDIQDLVAGALDGSVTRAQAASWLAFVCCKGMTAAETVTLTRCMTDSGERLSWPGIDGPIVDKHSTGGVGDKVSLPLAPVWAAMGSRVPMISGRGLGITGGTLDKLEAIPGYRTNLDTPALHRTLAEVGCFINGQTGQLAPADRFFYALRDETGTVPSVPLITASILSKKLAEGLDRLVLDVKCGSGAFMNTREDAEALAASLVAVGRGAGVDTHAHITDMSTPLGLAVGNAVEVQESVQCLRGGGPADLRELVMKFTGDPKGAAKVLDDGSAYEVWCRMVRAHGGDPDAPLRGGDVQEHVFLAPRSGRLSRLDAREVGLAAFVLGAGRSKASDAVHHGVGLWLRAQRGDTVEEGQPLVRVLHDQRRGLDSALRHLASAIDIEES